MGYWPTGGWPERSAEFCLSRRERAGLRVRAKDQSIRWGRTGRGVPLGLRRRAGLSHARHTVRRMSSCRSKAHSSRSADVEREFWKSFNDPQLNDLVESALAANHDIRMRGRQVARGARTARRSATGLRADGDELRCACRCARERTPDAGSGRRSRAGILRSRLRCVLGARLLRTRAARRRGTLGGSAVGRSLGLQHPGQRHRGSRAPVLRVARRAAAARSRTTQRRQPARNPAHHACAARRGSRHATRCVARTGAIVGDAGDDSGSRRVRDALDPAPRRPHR